MDSTGCVWDLGVLNGAHPVWIGHHGNGWETAGHCPILGGPRLARITEMADLLAAATHPRRRAAVAKSDVAGFEFGEEENVTDNEQDGGREMMETLPWMDLQ
ncbi:hypothetical protein ACLOJK_007201 [Asimina triloba]